MTFKLSLSQVGQPVTGDIQTQYVTSANLVGSYLTQFGMDWDGIGLIWKLFLRAFWMLYWHIRMCLSTSVIVNTTTSDMYMLLSSFCREHLVSGLDLGMLKDVSNMYPSWFERLLNVGCASQLLALWYNQFWHAHTTQSILQSASCLGTQCRDAEGCLQHASKLICKSD